MAASMNLAQRTTTATPKATAHPSTPMLRAQSLTSRPYLRSYATRRKVSDGQALKMMQVPWYARLDATPLRRLMFIAILLPVAIWYGTKMVDSDRARAQEFARKKREEQMRRKKIEQGQVVDE